MRKLIEHKFDNIEKEFLTEFKRIFDDIYESIQILRKTKKSLIKSELCLAFVSADAYSRIYKIFQGYPEKELDNEQGDRFRQWINDFVLTEKNIVYKKHKKEIPQNAENIYQLRNALVHFYGFPDSQKTGGVGFFMGPVVEKEKLEKFFRQKGKSITLFNPYWLIRVIGEGLLEQLKAMMEMINNNPDEYKDRVLFSHKIIMRQGARFLDLKGQKLKE